jgi:uncharacterized protein (DUF427 family)
MDRKRIEPGRGQKSAWDYPLPPTLEDVDKKVKVVFGEVTLAYTTRAKRVLETSHPPVYYIPPEAMKMEHLETSVGSSHCEWKGRSGYYDVTTEVRAAWFYPDPTPRFADLEDYVAFYPSRMDGCWILPDIGGPFKGGPGTWGW